MKKTSLFRSFGFAAVLALFSALPATCPALAQTTGASGDAPRFPNSEDLRHIKALSAPQLSPDGKQVLFILTDSTADGARSHLWLVPVDGGPSHQLTYSPAADKRGEYSHSWAPDGLAIFFLAKRGETTQLFRLPLAGGEAMPYDLKILPPVDDSKEKDFIPPAPKDAAKPEPLPINPSAYTVSPDNHWLAVWAEDPETPGEKKAKDAKADAVWVSHEHHGQRLYLAALKSDGTLDGGLKPVALAPDIHAVSWSPQSDRLLVLTEPPNNVRDLRPSAQAWLVSVANLDKPQQLTSAPNTISGSFGNGVSWSPDGNTIAFIAQTPEDAPPGTEELFTMHLSPPSQPTRLTAGFQGSINFNETVFLPNGKLLAAVNQGTKVSAVQLAMDGQSAPEAIPQTTSIVTGLSTNRRQTGWVWLAEGSDQPATLCYAPAPGGQCKALPVPELAAQRFRAVKSQLISWQNEGLTIEGLLYLPPQAAHQKVPLVMDIHGGPLSAWEDSYSEWTNFLLGHGWAILRPNPRGSSAYGVKFAAVNKNDLGGADFRDIMAGLDYALKNYPIDSGKLALMGYSYGGEMAAFVEGKTDRFQAIISGAPVIDQFSEYGTERGSWYDRWYYGKPWEHFEDAWRQSPLSVADKAKTPFLLLQGQADLTDPLGQAEEMYRALRQAGAPVEMVSYPREDHGPLARGIFGYPVAEPWHGYDGRQRIVQFLQKAFGEEQK